ncbi:putative threonine dehydratase [Panulirus ornatus]|uniref:putative threonine dehydratase n=1 Tax=Panulirus ornatus TaxID=150431 RepID=UPI003A83C347
MNIIRKLMRIMDSVLKHRWNNMDSTIKMSHSTPAADSGLQARSAMKINTLATLVKEAAQRITPYILHTPLLFTPALSQDTGVNIHLKLENEQITGSFKARGAFNTVGVLAAEGVTTVYIASTGNHGLACVPACRTFNVACQVVVPVTADLEKKEKLRANGANLREHGTDCSETEAFTRRLAKEHGSPYLSPYNEYLIMAGQGTVGREILLDLPEVDAIFVAVGGGGLISGVAAYVKSHRPTCKVVGCSPARSKVMHESVRAGRIIQEDSEETLSDGTAGGLEEGALTFPLCRDLVDDWILVDEEEIAQAVYYCLKQHRKVVEGASGVALAAVKKAKAQYQGQQVAVVMCGANISMKNLQTIIQNYA